MTLQIQHTDDTLTPSSERIRVVGALLSNAAYSLQTPTTGFNIQMEDGVQVLVMNPAGTLSGGTVVLPPNPWDRS